MLLLGCWDGKKSKLAPSGRKEKQISLSFYVDQPTLRSRKLYEQTGV